MFANSTARLPRLEERSPRDHHVRVLTPSPTERTFLKGSGNAPVRDLLHAAKAAEADFVRAASRKTPETSPAFASGRKQHRTAAYPPPSVLGYQTKYSRGGTPRSGTEPPGGEAPAVRHSVNNAIPTRTRSPVAARRLASRRRDAGGVTGTIAAADALRAGSPIRARRESVLPVVAAVSGRSHVPVAKRRQSSVRVPGVGWRDMPPSLGPFGSRQLESLSRRGRVASRRARGQPAGGALDESDLAALSSLTSDGSRPSADGPVDDSLWPAEEHERQQRPQVHHQHDDFPRPGVGSRRDRPLTGSRRPAEAAQDEGIRRQYSESTIRNTSGVGEDARVGNDAVGVSQAVAVAAMPPGGTRRSASPPWERTQAAETRWRDLLFGSVDGPPLAITPKTTWVESKHSQSTGDDLSPSTRRHFDREGSARSLESVPSQLPGMRRMVAGGDSETLSTTVESEGVPAPRFSPVEAQPHDDESKPTVHFQDSAQHVTEEDDTDLRYDSARQPRDNGHTASWISGFRSTLGNASILAQSMPNLPRRDRSTNEIDFLNSSQNRPPLAFSRRGNRLEGVPLLAGDRARRPQGSLVPIQLPEVPNKITGAFAPRPKEALQGVLRTLESKLHYDEAEAVAAQVVHWTQTYDSERRSFHSVEKFIGVKISEARHISAELRSPSPYLAAVACDLLGSLAEELHHRKDTKVLIHLHRYIVSCIYPGVDTFDPSIEDEYNCVEVGPDGVVQRRSTRLLFYLSRDPYFVANERLKLGLELLATERAAFFRERRRQLELHSGMDSMLQRITVAWRGDLKQRYFRMWRENMAYFIQQRRMVSQIRRTRGKMLAIKAARKWKALVRSRRLQRQEFEHMRRVEEMEELSRRIEGARRKTLEMMEEMQDIQGTQESLEQELETLRDKLRRSKTSGHKAFIRSLRNVTIEGIEMMFEFGEAALEWELEEEPFEHVDDLMDTSCLLFHSYDEDENGSDDDGGTDAMSTASGRPSSRGSTRRESLAPGKGAGHAHSRRTSKRVTGIGEIPESTGTDGENEGVAETEGADPTVADEKSEPKKSPSNQAPQSSSSPGYAAELLSEDGEHRDETGALTTAAGLHRWAGQGMYTPSDPDAMRSEFEDLPPEQGLLSFANILVGAVRPEEMRRARSLFELSQDPASALPASAIQDMSDCRATHILGAIKSLMKDEEMREWRAAASLPSLPEDDRQFDSPTGVQLRDQPVRQGARTLAMPDRLHCAVVATLASEPPGGLVRRDSAQGEAPQTRTMEDAISDDEEDLSDDEDEGMDVDAAEALRQSEAAKKVVSRAYALDDELRVHVSAAHVHTDTAVNRQLLLISRLFMLWHSSRRKPSRSRGSLLDLRAAKQLWRSKLFLFARLPHSIFSSISQTVFKDALKLLPAATAACERSFAAVARGVETHLKVRLWRSTPSWAMDVLWDRFRTRVWRLPNLELVETKWKRKKEFMDVKTATLRKDVFLVIDDKKKSGTMSEAEMEREVKLIRRVLARHNKLLALTFRHYNTIAGGDDGGATMTQNALRRLIQDCRMMKLNELNTNLSLIFQKAAQGGPRGNLGGPEFVSAIIRLTRFRYKTGKLTHRRVEHLIERYIERYAKQTDSSHFRAMVNDSDVRRVVDRYRADIHRLFVFFAKADTADTLGDIENMNFKEFILLLKAASLFDARLTQQAAKLVFAHSQMESDEMDDGDDAGGDAEMVEEELVEALSAAAAYRNPNPYVPFSRRLEMLLVQNIVPAAKKASL